MKALEIRNVSVVFDHHHVLENINLEIDEGDFLIIIGPNGAGKSTLFKAILGLVHYDGEIHIFGKPTVQQRNLIGYVPQHFHFDRTLPINVKEFLRFSLFTKGKFSEMKILPALQELDIHHLSEKGLGKLSGGELQRVLLTRAIFSNPKMLLLDEPVSGIDIVGKKDFFEIIDHLNKFHQITILMITHDISAIPKSSNKILVLNRYMVYFGPTKEFSPEKYLHKVYGRQLISHKYHHFHHQIKENEL